MTVFTFTAFMFVELPQDGHREFETGGSRREGESPPPRCPVRAAFAETRKSSYDTLTHTFGLFSNTNTTEQIHTERK